MEEFFKSIFRALTDSLTNVHALLVGALASVAGYFLPVRDIVHLLILFFILDVFLGYWAARKLRKEKFSVKIIWATTIPRMLISIILIISAYMWDTTYRQDYVSTYKIIGWFISGVLIYSIAKNGYIITKWSVFRNIGSMFKDRLKDKGVTFNNKRNEQVKDS